jgi:small subunit ribosomal protein S21
MRTARFAVVILGFPFRPRTTRPLPMAIRIKARGGETAEQMLRRFKKLCEKEGLTKEVKKRQYYEKPSERRRRDLRRRVVRVAREAMGPMARPGR